MKASTTQSRVNRIFGCTGKGSAHEIVGKASLIKHRVGVCTASWLAQ